jgi:hypothetical protein
MNSRWMSSKRSRYRRKLEEEQQGHFNEWPVSMIRLHIDNFYLLEIKPASW